MALSRSADEHTVEGAEAVAADLTERGATEEAVASARPDVVYHLAALASVPESWRDPATTLS